MQGAYSGDKVINTKGTYHPIREQGIVFGSICTHRLNFMLTEVKHLVVHPLFRKMGLGKTLINTAMAKADTPVMYATIRESNIASLHIFTSAGFKIVSTAKIKDHNTHFLTKDNETYNKDSTEGGIELPESQWLQGNQAGVPDGTR